jgi:hypothetical protein
MIKMTYAQYQKQLLLGNANPDGNPCLEQFRKERVEKMVMSQLLLKDEESDLQVVKVE